MKKVSFIIIAISLSFYFNASAQYQSIVDHCNLKESRTSAKDGLKPEFQYDAANTIRFKYGDEPQRKEVEVPLYFGEKYRFVFNAQGAPQPVTINVYNKKFSSSKKELLFTSSTFPETDEEYIWEPEKSKKMHVIYDIPATNDTIKKGCVVMVLGYKIKGLK